MQVATYKSSWSQESVFLGDGTQGYSYFALGLPAYSGGVVTMEARNTTSYGNNSLSKITDGNWHHIVGVYVSSTNRILYVDGISVDTNTSSVPMVAHCNRIGIGGLSRSSPTDDYYGALADVGIWAQALTPQKVALLNGMGLFEQLPLTNSIIDDLVAVYNAGSGSVQVGPHVWAYTNGLSGTAGATGGTVSAANAYIVLDGAGNGVQLQMPPQPFIVSFSVSADEIVLGSTVTLSWNVTNATSVLINQGIGTVSSSGTLLLTPTNTTTWTLTASNVAGVVTNAVTVSVDTDPFIAYFRDNVPGNVYQSYPGAPVTLSWSVSNATTEQITPGVGSVPATGTVIVNPTVTTTYTLAVSNSYSTNLFTSALTVLVGLTQAPVDYYPLNESSGTIAHDAASNSRNMTTTSSPNSGGLNPSWEPTGGPIGGAIMFDATAQSDTGQAFVWTTNGASPNMVVTNYPFTIACWMQVPIYQSGWEQEWVYFGDDTSGSSYYAIGIEPPTGLAAQ
jgi:hypothetical protein